MQKNQHQKVLLRIKKKKKKKQINSTAVVEFLAGHDNTNQKKRIKKKGKTLFPRMNCIKASKQVTNTACAQSREVMKLLK